MEDCIEEIIQQKILDETDRVTDEDYDTTNTIRHVLASQFKGKLSTLAIIFGYLIFLFKVIQCNNSKSYE